MLPNLASVDTREDSNTTTAGLRDEQRRHAAHARPDERRGDGVCASGARARGCVADRHADRPGVYHLGTIAGEDYPAMVGMKTIGKDNVLTLTIVVS
jgi:hypothetical protein